MLAPDLFIGVDAGVRGAVANYTCILSIVNLGNVESNPNTILETKWSMGKTPIVSSNLTLVTTLGKLYTEVPSRTGATK